MDDFMRGMALGFGVLGMGVNLLLVVALFRTQRGWNRLNLQLVGPIAALDFLATFLITFSSILSFSMGNTEMLTSTWYCAHIGVILQTLPVLCMILIGAMAVDRYCLVVHGHGIGCVVGWLVICSICLLVTGLKIANTAVYGLRPDPSATYCQTFGHGKLTKVNQKLSTFLFLVGLPLITFCYLAIFVHCRRFLSTHNAFPLRYLFVLLAYEICLLPKFITSVWKLFADKSSIPHFITLTASLGFNLLFFTNPCLVFGFQANLRKELRRLFFPAPSTSDIPLTDNCSDKPYSTIP
ncbi:hypothetical protein DSO57_1026991 [Entomophthora muscae]|uniref:Uncharacterized protein n=1 Tax=Entomophthora muscae TaxID=34485 RepID=A0ACC2RST8_9FUNG|nr:hypothetical protein DSO57_1026991 [Entomophthora muscae]